MLIISFLLLSVTFTYFSQQMNDQLPYSDATSSICQGILHFIKKT